MVWYFGLQCLESFDRVQPTVNLENFYGWKWRRRKLKNAQVSTDEEGDERECKATTGKEERLQTTDTVVLQANCAIGRKLLGDAVQPRNVDHCTGEAVLCDPLPPEDVHPVAEETIRPPDGNRIVDMSVLQTLIDCVAVCGHCHVGKLTLVEDHARRRGWASYVTLKCNNVECTAPEAWNWTSKATDTGAREVNKLSVLAMRTIGKGQRGAATFASHMNMPAPILKPTWRKHTLALGDTAQEGLQEDFDRVILKAKRQRIREGLVEGVDPEVEMTEEDLRQLVVDLPVSMDGSWLSRGANSKHGFVTAISADTGEVVDRHYMSRTCRACQQWDNKDKNSIEYLDWYLNHGPDCLMNHSGSASAMEADGAAELFSRSMHKYNVRYNPYIGDGHSSAYKRICKEKPYGEDFTVEKEECIGHIKKRMGTRLRRELERNKGKVLSDGKSLGGRGRLTMARVNALQIFNGIGLWTFAGDAAAMSKATWAMLKHYGDPPNHEDCPGGESSWCKHQQDKALGTNTYRPPAHPLAPAVTEAIWPLFQKLADPELLKSCSRAVTQNANESLHNVVWNIVPKNHYHSPEQVQLGIDLGILWYNGGKLATAAFLFEEEDMTLNVDAKATLKWMDSRRLQDCAYKATTLATDKRKERKQSQSSQLDAFRKDEGLMYASGRFHASSGVAVPGKRAPPKCRKCGKPRKGHPKVCTQPDQDF